MSDFYVKLSVNYPGCESLPQQTSYLEKIINEKLDDERIKCVYKINWVRIISSSYGDNE